MIRNFQIGVCVLEAQNVFLPSETPISLTKTFGSQPHEDQTKGLIVCLTSFAWGCDLIHRISFSSTCFVLYKYKFCFELFKNLVGEHFTIYSCLASLCIVLISVFPCFR